MENDPRINNAIKALNGTVGTLKVMRLQQNRTFEQIQRIGDQTSIQIKSLNTALDVVYRNRESMGFSPASLELVNALEQAVLCNYEIIACIGRVAQTAELAMTELEEVMNGN